MEATYRAWDTKENKMIDWDALFFGDCVWSIGGERYIAMQWTLMFDKNGTEIFSEDWLGTLSSMSKVRYDERRGAWYMGYERLTAFKACKIEIVKNTFTK